MPTICIGRETIESLSTGEPVALGQDCYAIPASGFDHPYKRIAELEAALRDVDAIAWCADSVAEVRERIGARLTKVLPKG
ncbi:MAG: hypothetical protein IPO08_22105 [Xanthomonadales bacterium]|nr:hypothetical protein [Xanthomonadales bacterium]